MFFLAVLKTAHTVASQFPTKPSHLWASFQVLSHLLSWSLKLLNQASLKMKQQLTFLMRCQHLLCYCCYFEITTQLTCLTVCCQQMKAFLLASLSCFSGHCCFSLYLRSRGHLWWTLDGEGEALFPSFVRVKLKLSS